MNRDTPTWEPRRKRLAARLPGCLVELAEPQLLRVVVPYADRPEITLRLGEPRWDERVGDWWLCSPASIDALVSHVFCMCFEETYSYEKWPPERVRALLGGPFDAHARGMVQHFVPLLEERAANARESGARFVEWVKQEVECGHYCEEHYESALRCRDGWNADAEERLFRAAAYAALVTAAP